VGRIINELVRQGVEIVTDRDGLVHVSGHPRRGELAEMYAWLKPKIAVPAHGEALHLTEHQRFARAQGVAHVIRPFNGDMVRLAPGEPAIIGQVYAGRVMKDGSLLTDMVDVALVERRKLAFAGVVTVAIAIDQKGEVVTDPEVTLTGLPRLDSDGEPILELIQDVVDDCIDGLTARQRRDLDLVRSAVERAVRGAVREAWNKKPICQVMVLAV